MAALKFIASACLAGAKCRYNGKDKKDKTIYLRVMRGQVLPLCPELLAGLPTPRKASQIKSEHGRKAVVSSTGEDLTSFYSKGASLSFRICKRFGIDSAYLKEGSPSCGCGPKDRKDKLPGMTSSLFKQKRIKIFSR